MNIYYTNQPGYNEQIRPVMSCLLVITEFELHHNYWFLTWDPLCESRVVIPNQSHQAKQC